MEYLFIGLQVLGGISAAATAIAALTPTKKDDKVANWLQKINGFASRVGIQIKK